MAVENLITEHIDVWTSAVKTRSTSGRGSSKKLELYGVKKLRELILELAVRGKLVPQDPNDEPASVLLEKIAQEQTQLIKDQKIKKLKKLPNISKDELLFDLPNGWQWCRVGNLFNTIQSGGTPSKRDPSYWEGNIPWASVKDLGKSLVLTDTQDHISEEGLIAGSKLANKGDLLICTRMGLGKIAIVSTPMAFNQDLKAVSLTKYVHTDFFLNSYRTIKIKGTGTTVAGISQDQLLNYVFSLPPLQEQHRIVAKVDELMALCDQLEQQTEASIEAHQVLVTTLLDTLTNSADADELMQNWARISEHFDTLFTTEESIDQLKKTILQLAVMGKLVPQDPSDEPAAELLKRIAEEKAQLVKEKKIKKQKALPPISEDEKPFNLPSGWEWCSLSSLGYFFGGKTPSKSNSSFWGGDVLWVTPKDMKRTHIDDSEDKITQAGVDSGLALVEVNSLMCVTRSGILRRHFPVALAKKQCTVNQDLKVLSFYDNSVADYVLLMMQGFEQHILDKLTKTGTTVESLKFDEFSVYPFMLPPLKEQRRIVSKVEDLMIMCEELKARLKYSRIIQQQLTDSIAGQAV
ncbi:restriction endonuclease subunit S [Vibrio parahaemolyticus]|jgi:type I restriction enzyme S subunit|uniref:Restriction endonuclease subunit S n=2 Tax=Vibrio parahaemolyticus TaxID=670 RepID=A0A7Y0SKV9_VIBPH|nr:restriction endonuclease subunit S [Vibrio parahaemolyticus]MDF4559473.1 restriction endonuclease subunit S [Vibrio parahaemolyticus]MDF5022180.1 restriction endonuclease subunit S [Vibrio parahaemolyticus]MDF5041744.1 restriction endonuclease subunit S [Vibrio parahaemolyticus]MDF5157632.1 restriction endonuclease subunit S [Vibrio parahaemolyticus]MDF5161710.1 restriction endonuclease subunit S [Vibrio parahaemolyticus]